MILDATFSENNSTFAPDVEEEGVTFSAQFSGGVGSGSGSGENGATFIPSVSEDGIISWTNDKGLANPKPVNIKGDEGDKGERGADGKSGVYILGEGESLDTVPEDVNLVVDPDGEGSPADELEGFVKYNEGQELTDDEKVNALGNIGALEAFGCLTSAALKWNGFIGNRTILDIEDDGELLNGWVRISDEVPIIEVGTEYSCTINFSAMTAPVPIIFEQMADGVFFGLSWDVAGVLIIQNDNTPINSNLALNKGVWVLAHYIIEKDYLIPFIYVSSINFMLHHFTDNSVIIRSSTEGSNKRFKLTVDDSGTINVTEVTQWI